MFQGNIVESDFQLVLISVFNVALKLKLPINSTAWTFAEIDQLSDIILVSLVNDIQIMIAAFPEPVREGIRKDRQLCTK